MTSDQTVGLITGLMCLTLVASSVATRRMPLGRTLRMAAAWVGIFFATYILILFRGEAVAVWSRVKFDVLGIETGISGGPVRVRARDDGHYYVAGRVNGHAVEFLVDSGATTTTLTADTARAANVVSDGMPPIPVATANGMALAHTAKVDRLEVGAIAQTNTRIQIQDRMDVDLLGMSFLSQLKSWRVEGDTLILQP